MEPKREQGRSTIIVEDFSTLLDRTNRQKNVKNIELNSTIMVIDISTTFHPTK